MHKRLLVILATACTVIPSLIAKPAHAQSGFLYMAAHNGTARESQYSLLRKASTNPTDNCTNVIDAEYNVDAIVQVDRWISNSTTLDIEFFPEPNCAGWVSYAVGASSTIPYIPVPSFSFRATS